MRNAFAIVLQSLLLCCASAAMAHAQAVRGTIRDSVTHTPIAGAAVLLSDSVGNLIARTLSNAVGEFRTSVRATPSQLRVLRIGYRPSARNIPASQTVLDVNLERLPSLLSEVVALESARCPKRGDRIMALSLWEQTRAALLATVIAREASPAFVRRLRFERFLSRDGTSIVRQTVASDSGPATRAFAAARTAADFVRAGFSEERRGEREYYGPDADVLLDEAFSDAYCFHLAATDVTRPANVGVAFAPARRIDGRVDIEGTAWIDSTTRQIGEIEFRYAGLPDDRTGIASGGRSTFADVGNGTAALVRWFIHMPFAIRQGTSMTIATRDAGGELAYLRWPDGVEWKSPLATLRGQVTRKGVAARGVDLQLIGTDYTATTDSAGNYEISALLPGPYEIGVVDSTLAEFDVMLTSHQTIVASRLKTEHVDFETPGLSVDRSIAPVIAFEPLHMRDFVGTRCATDDLDDHLGVVIVRVTLPDGSPAQGAQWQVNGDASGATDENGFIRLCRSAPGASVRLHVTARGFAPTTTTFRTVKGISAVNLEIAVP